MRKLTLVLDPAHGADVPGKCSPDGKHKEYRWSREACAKLEAKLKDKGFKVYYTTKAVTEIGLTKRTIAANVIKEDHKFLISLHNNAAGDGTKWTSARGYEVFTTPGVTTSDKYAEIVLKQLIKDFPSLTLRADKADGDLDKEAKFTVIDKTNFPSILIEWLFQDNKDDVALLEDLTTTDKFCDSIVKACEVIDSTL